MRRVLATLAALALLGAAAPAAPRTLASADGRTLEAEILGYRGETLRIRRMDTGREFKLPLSSLSPECQTETRAFLRSQPELRDTIPADAVRVEYSRSRFESERSKQSYVGVSTQHWGYTVTVINLTNEPLEGLRLDHAVFAETDPDHVRGKPDRKNLERVRGSSPLDPIAPRGRLSVRTEPIVTETQELTGGSRWITDKGLTNKIRDRALEGVWLRLYDGDKIVFEASSPESLRATERWGAD
ncbi:MAG: hypothetical protein MUE42_10035 [Opitutaceae bacterium]|nr:hypothetical protein [Opitutaceae bacterium]